MLNLQKKIKKIMMEQINKQAPKVNFDEAPLLDKDKIKSILPLIENHFCLLMK